MRDQEPTKALAQAAGVAFIGTVVLVASFWYFWVNTAW